MVTSLGDIASTTTAPFLLDGAIWVDGVDLGPVYCETPPRFGMGKPSATNLLQVQLDRSSLTLIEVTGKPFDPAALPLAQTLKRRVLDHLSSALDALASPPGTRVDDAAHSGSMPPLDWPTSLNTGHNNSYRDRSRALLAFQAWQPPNTLPIAPNLDPRLQRWLDWISAIPRLDQSALQIWHRPDGKQIILRMTTPKPPGLVTGARHLIVRTGGIIIEDRPKPAATHAESIHALRRLIALARCFQGVWHGQKPNLALELVFTEPHVSRGYRLSLGPGQWAMSLARLALGRATETEIAAVFHPFDTT